MTPEIPRRSATDAPRAASGEAPRAYQVAWPWRLAVTAADDEARRRAAARRGAAWRALVGIAVAAGLAFWKPPLAVVVVAVSLLVLALALASPLGAYARFEHLLGRFAHGVGTVVNWLLMPLLYVLLFLPAGLLLRARGSLRLTRRPDPRAATYWSSRDAARRWQGDGTDRYRRQF